MKILKRLLVGLLVLLAVAVVVLNTFLGRIVKTAVNEVGPSVMKVPVSLADADFRLLRGKLALEGLVIGNPEGFKSEKMFSLGKVAVDIEPASVAGDTIHIRRIHIDAPEITYEVGLGGSNIGALTDLLEGGKKDEKKPEPEEPAPEPRTKKKVVIDEVLVENGKVTLSANFLGGAGIPLPLPTISLKDVGKEKGGTSPAEAITSIFKAILGSVVKVVTESGKLVGKGAGAVVDGAEAVGGAAVEGVEAVGGAAVDAVKGVGGLLGIGGEEK